MNIQIFGTKKSNDSKKAERYFKERGIRFQGIDMNEKYRETAHGGLAQIHSVYEQLGPDNFDRIF